MDENAVLSACEETLRKVLGAKLKRTAIRGITGADAVFSAVLPGFGAVDLAVSIRRGLRPAALPIVLTGIRQLEGDGRRALLCTDYLSPPLAERLRALGVWYADAAGNAYMSEGKALYIYSDGRRLPPAPAPRGQSYSAAGARALYYLVRHGPKVSATYRQIQATTAVSLDKISKVFGELAAGRVLAVRGRGRYEVVGPDRLLELWSDAFADRLGPGLEIARYRAAEGEDLVALLRERATELGAVAVGGEIAAGLVTRRLRATGARLYLAPKDEDRIRRALRLAPAQDGPIVLCRVFATDLADETASDDGLPLAHAAVLYAELMAADDPRLGEAALQLRKERLAWTL